MFCSNCGKPVNPTQPFCGNCGASVVTKAPQPVPKKKPILKRWDFYVVVVLVLCVIGGLIVGLSREKIDVPIQYGPRITEEYIRITENDEQLHATIQDAIKWLEKNHFDLQVVVINPQTPEVTAQGLHACVIFYADYIYLDDDADEQELLIKATEAYTQLTNIFTRQKNLYYDPWIVFAVYHPTKGWGLTVFAPGSYTPEILYGRYTEATLPYPDM